MKHRVTIRVVDTDGCRTTVLRGVEKKTPKKILSKQLKKAGAKKAKVKINK